MSAEYSVDAAFDAWVATLPAKHWAKYDISACRLGWEAQKAERIEADESAVPADSGRAGDAATALANLVNAAALMLSEIDTCGHDVDPAYRLCLYEAWEHGKAALAAQGQGGELAWRIGTDDDVERVAKAAGWDNRSYMTRADYAIWCSRMREFVRLAAEHPAPPASPAGVPDGWRETFAELLEDYAGARAEVAAWNATQRVQPEGGVRLPRSRLAKLMDHVDLLAAAAPEGGEVGL